MFLHGCLDNKIQIISLLTGVGYLWCILEGEASKQKQEAAAADVECDKPLTDNKADAMTSSQDTFLPYDATSGKSAFISKMKR